MTEAHEYLVAGPLNYETVYATHEPPVIDKATYLIVDTSRDWLTRHLLRGDGRLVDWAEHDIEPLDPADWLLEKVDINPVNGECQLLFRPIANAGAATRRVQHLLLQMPVDDKE